MRFFRSVTSSAIGLAVVLGLSGAAFAASAVATGNVNVRSGPSAQYERVSTLQRNQVVEVVGCRDGWCFVEKRGTDGWVSSRFLQAIRQQSSRPAISFSFNFGSPPNVRPPRHHQGNGNGDWNGNNNGGGHDNGGGHQGGNQGGGWNDGPRYPYGN